MAAPSPEPFRLDVPEETLDDLTARLERARWPDEIPGSDWRYGSNLAYVQRLVERWRDGFDWRAQEAELNAFAQYRVARAVQFSRLAQCGAVILAADLGTAAMIFSFTPFVAQVGIQYWFLAGALHGVAQRYGIEGA